jgi:hypothetical protein
VDPVPDPLLFRSEWTLKMEAADFPSDIEIGNDK